MPDVTLAVVGDVHASRRRLERVFERAGARGVDDVLLVGGHIHESPSAVRLSGRLCRNVGGLGEPWGKAQVGIVAWRADGRHVAEPEGLESGEVRRRTRES